MDEDQLEEVKDDLLAEVDEATEPDKMGAADAYQVLDMLRTDLGFRMEALRQENAPESEDW